MSDEPIEARVRRLVEKDLRSERFAARELGISRRQVRNALGRTSEFYEKGLAWTAEGVRAEEGPDEDEVYARAVREYQRTSQVEQRRRNQRVVFNAPAVMLVFAGDQHLGNAGTDYEHCYHEAELVRDTPGMAAWLCGDLLDNFIIGKLRQARDDARLSIPDEWALVRRYLRIVGPKLIGATAGNHDAWTKLLAGVDYFRDVLTQINPTALYDTDDSRVTIVVGGEQGHAFKARIRHKWRGSSIYNVTHGQERATLFDEDGEGVDLVVGAHTHTAGVARGFTRGGASKLAVQVGSYKRVDGYAKREGFSMPNGSTAVAVLLTESGEMSGFESMGLAADVISSLLQ